MTGVECKKAASDRYPPLWRTFSVSLLIWVAPMLAVALGLAIMFAWADAAATYGGSGTLPPKPFLWLYALGSAAHIYATYFRLSSAATVAIGVVVAAVLTGTKKGGYGGFIPFGALAGAATAFFWIGPIMTYAAILVPQPGGSTVTFTRLLIFVMSLPHSQGLLQAIVVIPGAIFGACLAAGIGRLPS